MKVIGRGYESWELYYNLGNAFYKNRQIGPAILNYEKARKLAPNNEDVLFNLELANLRVGELARLQVGQLAMVRSFQIPNSKFQILNSKFSETSS